MQVFHPTVYIEESRINFAKPDIKLGFFGDKTAAAPPPRTVKRTTKAARAAKVVAAAEAKAAEATAAAARKEATAAAVAATAAAKVAAEARRDRRAPLAAARRRAGRNASATIRLAAEARAEAARESALEGMRGRYRKAKRAVHRRMAVEGYENYARTDKAAEATETHVSRITAARHVVDEARTAAAEAAALHPRFCF